MDRRVFPALGARPQAGDRHQPTAAAPWWRSGLLYQVYVRSFADSNGDGVGDLLGVIQHLDHLAWLGVDGIWLSPITVSPNHDWGYDVADYCDIQPEYGNLDDFDRLVSEAGRRGIRVVLDLVPNHTSSLHPWFIESRASRNSRHRDWYVWADPKPDGSPPNNWLSAFGGPAWTLDESTGQMYLHNFAPEQPDLNWWNEEVRQAFDEIQCFWLDRGAAGFRIDVCHMVVKDQELRDNPPARDVDGFAAQLLGQRPLYNSNQPEVHEAIRRWRRTADAYAPSALLFGETVVYDLRELAAFYGQGDELHLALNVPLLETMFAAVDMRALIEATERALPQDAWPVWAGSNHDVPRMASRWAQGDPRKTTLALMMLLTLRGTPLLYQGDEIGLTDTVLSREELQDPAGLRYWPLYKGRDGARTPMPWSAQDGGGFTASGVTPWLRLGDVGDCNVASQREERLSTLNLTRDLIALRRRTPDLQLGDYEPLQTPEETWAWRRGERALVALNLSDEPARIAAAHGEIAICSNRDRDGEAVVDWLELGPQEGAVLISDQPLTTKKR